MRWTQVILKLGNGDAVAQRQRLCRGFGVAGNLRALPTTTEAQPLIQLESHPTVKMVVERLAHSLSP
ncbi:Exportin-5 [Manis pentadactyla]|nr:Exportin-5 [Manis pentadactyla]